MNNIEKILEDSRALLSGHFKLTSGRHSDRYIEKIKIINQPDKVVELCKSLTERLKDIDCDIVVGPAMGGIVLAFEVAKNLGKKFVFTQRKDGKMTIRSGFEVKAGNKAIIIEDIVTTGGSVREVIDILLSKGVKVEAIGLIADRTGGKIDFGVRKEALLEIKIESWKEDVCPLCKKGIPLTKPGSSDKK